MIRLLFPLLLMLIGLPAMAERHALVVGNGGYSGEGFLPNAPNDARDMAAALGRQGFQVTLLIDGTRRELMGAVQSFSRRLAPEDTALFFYAGHGMQIGSDNYVLPIDAGGGSETALAESSVRLQSLLATLETRAATRIIILDACRNNPFLASRGTSRAAEPARGLKRVDAGVGSFIAFSTAPGAVASDGATRNSPFTHALLRHMTRPGDNIHAVMRRVRADVMESTGNRQIPWENSALIDEVFLASLSAPGTISQAPVAPQAPAFVASHVVQGLDPQGDGFLALRRGPSSEFPMVMMLTEGAPLTRLETAGRWWRIRTPEGVEGWAHSNWIRPKTQRPSQGQTGLSCDALWYQRNAIFAARGYCFRSARGQAAFPNPDCLQGVGAGDIPLSAAERDQVAALKAQEKRQGCR